MTTHPTSYDERTRAAVEQCIARRWNDWMLSVAHECRADFLDVLKYAREMQQRASQVDGESPAKRGPREDARRRPCGTPAAYERHRRHREEPCQPCKTAHAERVAQRDWDRRGSHRSARRGGAA